jgi:hypothetical protein
MLSTAPDIQVPMLQKIPSSPLTIADILECSLDLNFKQSKRTRLNF